MTELYIKNMVCGRCILVVKEELEKLMLKPLNVDLGIVRIEDDLKEEQKAQLAERLSELGFELLDDSRMRIIERIKNAVIKKIYHSDDRELKVNWSQFISSELHHDYNSLSSLFSSVEGITLEQYIIRQKIERAKELLFYDELTLNEISYRLGYSSVQHLSSQFKKVTGQTPSQFKASRLSGSARSPLDSII